MDSMNLEVNTDMNEAMEPEIAGESKADKFKRIGERRVNNTLTAITRLGALSGSAYEYTDEQIDAMFGVIQNTLDSTREKFKKKEKEAVVFKF